MILRAYMIVTVERMSCIKKIYLPILNVFALSLSWAVQCLYTMFDVMVYLFSCD